MAEDGGWDGITPGHSQLAFIIVLEQNTRPASQEDLQLLRTENTDKDALFELKCIYTY